MENVDVVTRVDRDRLRRKVSDPIESVACNCVCCVNESAHE
jgi:hypothetical protein